MEIVRRRLDVCYVFSWGGIDLGIVALIRWDCPRLISTSSKPAYSAG